MSSKYVSIIPEGIYYFCPYCGKKMETEGQPKFCTNCGGELNWDNVNEFRKVISVHCPFEDTDDRCKYYGGNCRGSERCDYVCMHEYLRKNMGRLTSFEKYSYLLTKDYFTKRG